MQQMVQELEDTYMYMYRTVYSVTRIMNIHVHVHVVTVITGR